ncbi:MAG: carboxypeptidase regulatory-like domain-containing protein [Acidobacteriota bacterium]
MIMRLSRTLLLAALCCAVLLAPKYVFSQADQGSISGVVQDASGAVIPNADVTLTSTDTGLVLKTTTSSTGFYIFSPIKIGNYSVSAVAPGFSETKQEQIHVDVQARLNVPLTLHLGAVTQSVTVSTAPPLLQTESGSVGQVMSTQTINNMPLNGRNAVYVAQLAPGVVSGVGGRGIGTGDFTANGQRPTQNNFILDGIDNNTAVPDFLNGSSFVVNPPPDALAEFNVQTSNYSAELGHSAGAVMNTSIKTGTNQLHGDLWEYVRNTSLDAQNWNALTIPAYHENQFGATLGSPIIRDKLFFFGYAEANRIVFGQTFTNSVPTALMRTGDFSEILNPALNQQGVPITLYQPGSAGTQLLQCNGKQNVICPGNVNTVAKTLMDLYPLPNANGGKLYSNYVNNTNAVSNSWQWGTRIDWNLSAKDQMFARFSYLNIRSNYPSPLGPVLDGGSYGNDGNISNLSGNIAFSETHLFSPTLVNEFRFGFNYGNFQFRQAVFDNTNLAASLGMGGIPSGGPLGGGLPLVTLSGISGFGQPGFYPNHKAEDVYQFLDNITKIIGNHSLKFGVLLQSVRFPFFSPPNARGTYNYSGFFTSEPGKSFTGYGPADFMLNQMDSATVPQYHQLNFFHWTRGVYIQDDWRTTRKLTLNLGLRYDNFQPVTEVSGLFANFNIRPQGPGAAISTLTYSTSQKNTALSPNFTSLLAANNVPISYSGNRSLVNSQQTNFAPRIGFAYSFDPQTVLRGGFGLFFSGPENIGGPETMQNYPFQFTANFPRGNTCTPGNCTTNGITLEDGFSTILSEGLLNDIQKPGFAGSQPDIKTTYTQSYNLALERSLTNNLVATLSYVGNETRHLEVNVNLNSPAALIDPRVSTQTVQPYSAFGGAGMNLYEGTSTYNALQATIQKRFANGLTFVGSYTWAHSMDDASQPLGGIGYRGINLIGMLNDYTDSQADVRNRVTFNGYYELPFGQGKRFLSHGGVLNAIVGGWTDDLQFTAQTGFPFSVGTNLGTAGPNGGSANAIRVRDPFGVRGSPDPSNPSVSCATSTRNKLHWYNPCAFANPPLAFPDASIKGSPVSTNRIIGLDALPYLGGRFNTVHGPGFERINTSLFKNITVYREDYLQFRADIFNLLNTPSLANPSTSNNATPGGQITGPQFFQNFTPDARFIQLSAKFVF